MKLQLAKQYPFSFVAMVFKILGKQMDNQRLSKFDACEVDAFVRSRSDEEKEAIKYALSHNKTKLTTEEQKSYLAAIVIDFERDYQNGRFGLVSLADFNALALGLPKVITMADKLKRISEMASDCVRDRIDDVRIDIGCFISQSKNYSKEKPKTVCRDQELFTVMALEMDSYGRQLLTENGIQTIGDLSRTTADYLLSIKGFGDKRLAAARKSLDFYGLHLLGE